MLITFFQELKSAGVPVTLREYLTLMEAMDKDLASRRVEDFYYLSRATLVKDERNLDKFDRVFGHVFKGLEFMEEALTAEIPEEWLKKLTEKYLTEEEKKQIEAMGGLDKLMETLQTAARRAEGPPSGRQQMDRHRRHLAVRQWRLQPGRHPHRRREHASPRGEGVGQARVQGFRRRGRDRHPQHQGRAAPASQIRAHRRARRTRSRRHHQGHRAQGLSRHPHAARSGTMR